MKRNNTRYAWMLVLVPIVVTIIFSSCKRGEEDPFLSLRSRKARIVAKWTITEVKEDGQVQPMGNTTFTLEFKKDGTGTSVITSGSNTSTSEFRWDFLGGNGDFKKKERIIIIDTDQPDGEVYEIVMLKNKDMKMHAEETNGSSVNTVDYTMEVK